MSPNRSGVSPNQANREGRILLALNDLKQGRIRSLRAAIRLYDLPYSTIQDCATGVSSRVKTGRYRRKVTELEEDSLVQ